MNKQKTYIFFQNIRLLLLSCLLCLCACQAQSEKPTYNVLFTIISQENKFFNRYDVDLAIDHTPIGTLKHGGVFEERLPVTAGRHTLSFTKKNGKVTASTPIHVTGDASFYCRIKTRSKKIEISDIQEKITSVTTPAYKKTTEEETTDSETLPPLTLTTLDVGQGLSLLFETDGHAMLYDGGPRERSSYVVSYLQHHGITELDHVFVSHYDDDHLAGIIGVLNTCTVKEIIAPDYVDETDLYQSYHHAVEEKNIPVIHSQPHDQYQFGPAVITILSALPDALHNNDRSIAIKITYGHHNIIITGDGMQKLEETLLNDEAIDLKCNLYVAGHHGSHSSSSEAFLNAMNADDVIISVGQDNPYGFPHEDVITRFQDHYMTIYRTDEHGEITVVSDGEMLTITAEKQPGNITRAADEEETEITYILNTNTHVFHYLDCRFVKQMKDKNKREETATRSKIIAQGYTSCGIYHP